MTPAERAGSGLLRAGDRISGWIVGAPLGEGAMGTVYRVRSEMGLQVEAALKVMKPSRQGDARALFIREAEALSSLRHPAIVHVIGFSEDAERGLLCLFMELAEGETLRHRLAGGPMALPEALRTFVPLASALAHAHALGIFHRDVKPANVVLCADGPRLVDFGIAFAAREPVQIAETQMGTLAYLPPEVFAGRRADPAAMDVYAFGLLLHEAVTGSRGFAVRPGLAADAAAEDIGERKRRSRVFDPGPAVPQALREAVRGATDPDPARRPSMADVRSALESLLERRGFAAPAAAGRVRGHTGADSPGEPTTYVAEPRRRSRWWIGLGLAVAAAAAVAAAVLAAR